MTSAHDTTSGDPLQIAATDPPVPSGVDPTKPSIARVYDYALRGKINYPADRAVGHYVWRRWPEVRMVGWDFRITLQRMVRYLVAEAGIRQIIDLGSGLPTEGNVHEIAHGIDPQTRVVYVDNDPTVHAHSQALLADNGTTTLIDADILRPDEIFEDPTTCRYVDQSRPFAVLACAILHHLTDEQDPIGITTAIKRRLPSGGYLLVTNFLDDGDPRAPAMERTFLENALGTGRVRTFAEQLPYFDGLEMVEPGLVRSHDWRPDQNTPRNSPTYNLIAAGLGRKP